MDFPKFFYEFLSSKDIKKLTKKIHRLSPMDLKIYSLERNPRL
jgi:hypothetical protein